jgi:hypothetical protein
MRFGSVCLAIICAASCGYAADLFAQQPAAGQAPAAQTGREGGRGQGGQGGQRGQGGEGAQGGQAGGGRGRGAPPQTPAPRNAQGRVILGGKGVWTPSGFGITAPLLATDKTPYQPWAKALYEFRQANELEPHTRCKPSGFARQFLTPYGVEFVELPELQRIFIFDIGGPHTYRTIYMDGRQHPEKLTPSYYGHSIGRWDGDTLVVDTVGYNESFWMDRRGMPHTEQLHTIERFTRTSTQQIRYDVTVEDPGAYTAPWSSGLNLAWNDGQELFEYICQQSNYAGELMVGELNSVDRSSPIIP